MSRKPSAETLLRTERRRNNDLRAERDALKANGQVYLSRLVKAEQEAAEWKRRFDALLKIVPPSDIGCADK